jgi:signal transduction histidine kinase/CheY-like chemotaxis protein/AraC-like DNA-binding protein/ligand-binding sensor domain-containing protein
MNKRWTLFFLALQLMISTVVAQPNYHFRNYTKADGLKEFGISIVQDGFGFVWILDPSTIQRFDGHTFKLYQHDPEDSLLNLGQQIMSGTALIDPRGNLWINNMQDNHGSRSGYLVKYDMKTDGFIRFSPKGVKEGNVAFSIDGSLIWIGGKGTGLHSFNPNTRETKHYFNVHPDSLTQSQINNYWSIWDRGSYLLLTTRRGLWRWDKKTEAFSRPKCDPTDSAFLYSALFSFESLPDSSNNRWVRCIRRSPDRSLNSKWQFSSEIDRKSFYRLDSNLSISKTFRLPEAFQYDLIESLDRHGVIWFLNHKKGIWRYDDSDGSFARIENLPDDRQSTYANLVEGSCIGPDFSVWILTAGGISHNLKQTIRIHNTPFPQIAQTMNVASDSLIFGATDGLSGGNVSFWLGKITLTDSLRFDPIPYEPLERVGVPISSKSNKRFWVAGFAGITGFVQDEKKGRIELKANEHYAQNENFLTSNGFTTVGEDAERNLWIGTLHGLNKVKAQDRGRPGSSVARYAPVPGDTASMIFQEVYEFLPESKDSLWVSTGVGLELLVQGQFTHAFRDKERVGPIFKASDGTLLVGTEGGLYEGRKSRGVYTFAKSKLVTGSIRNRKSFAEDKRGRIWIRTNEGVVCLDRRENLAIKVTTLDGLLAEQNNLRELDQMAQMADGTLVLAFDKGFSVFDPMTLQIDRRKTQPLVTKLLVNNRPPVVGNRHANPDDFKMRVDVVMAKELTLDYQHNNFSLEFSAMEMIVPERNLYQHKLEGYDQEWIQTDWRNRTATYTNLPAGTYTFRLKASNYQGIWSDNEKTLSIVVLPPPWRTWWAYSGYSLLAVALLLFARRTIVQRERLKSNLQLAIVEQEKEHFELEKAKEVDRVKTSFFTNISHEFRTPLTLIKGPVESLIEKFKDDPEAVKRLNLVKRNSQLLLRLINQLLDLAKLESGTLKVEKSEGNPFSLVRAVASSFESFARQKGVHLVVDVPNKYLSASFDKDKLETILINLINNAIKFTPNNGTITITAQVYFYDLVLVIKDTGIGIPKDHQGKIFERFHQVSEAHNEVGTGIGLSLVKELVCLMEGRITVTSEEGTGSEFMVTLPIGLVAEVASNESVDHSDAAGRLDRSLTTDHSLADYAEIASLSKPITQEDTGKPHVLVVEDNADLRAFIIDSLGTEFYFLEASDGKQGLESATASVPDLIISDVMMPEMDGVEMTQKIKADIRSSHIPVVLLTAKSGEDSKLSGLQSGAEDYLTKPFNKQELLLKVRNRISLQLKLREKLRLELMKEAPIVNVQSADEKFLLRIKELIHERMSDEQLSVESMADEIGISRSQLYRKVTALTGLSMNELIRNFRLKRAAQLLQQNWGPVSQVAYEVGFSNLSYFSKVFKEEYGVLPSEYEKLEQDSNEI